MTITRRTLLVFAALVYGAAPFAAQQAPGPTRPLLTPEQMEQFLLTAEIVSVGRAGDGRTNSQRATLTNGQLTHDAHIQTVDEARAVFETLRGVERDFKDTYRYNIAGYRLATLLGLDNVPVSVERNFQRRPASFTWWIDDVAMNEEVRAEKGALGPDPQRFAHQVHIMRVFDELIQNTDRNMGNIQWTGDWTIVVD